MAFFPSVKLLLSASVDGFVSLSSLQSTGNMNNGSTFVVFDTCSASPEMTSTPVQCWMISRKQFGILLSLWVVQFTSSISTEVRSLRRPPMVFEGQ